MTSSISISKRGNRIRMTGNFADSFFKAAIAAQNLPAKKFKSVAIWPTGVGIHITESSDTHDTREQAEAVCKMLRRDGFGGDGKIFPIETRVEEV